MIAPTGELKDMTVPRLFLDLLQEKSSGTVTFTRDKETKNVFFKSGDIISATSNLDDDRLGDFLLRKGAITRDQFDRAAGLVGSSGRQWGAVLFEMQALTPQDLVSRVKQQAREIVLAAFSWQYGRYAYDKGALPVADIIPLPISTAEIVLEGIAALDWKVVRKSVPPLKTVLRPVANKRTAVALNADQQAVLGLIDGITSLEEICLRSPIGDFNTLKAIYLLLATGTIEAGTLDRKVAEKMPTQAAEAVPLSVTREMILSAYESLDLLNLYELLGVGKGATTLEIKKAYFQYAKLYHPDRHLDADEQDLKPKLALLFSRIHEAYETLSSKQKRDEYNVELASGVKRHKPLATKTKEDKPDNKAAAQVQFNEGMKRFNQSDFWGADEAFQWAMRLDGENAEYVFRRGLALSRIPRRGHEAEEYYLKAIEMAPTRVDYHLELGSFYAKRGMKSKAFATYQEGLVHNPTSDRIKDAIRSLS